MHFAFNSIAVQNFMPLTTKLYLAQTLIQAIIDYVDACYLDATEPEDKLERLQNWCIRFVNGFRNNI